MRKFYAPMPRLVLADGQTDRGERLLRERPIEGLRYMDSPRRDAAPAECR